MVLDDSNCPLPHQHACGWAALMLVFCHWRAAALSSPTLWRVLIVDRSTRWLNLALQCSREVTLNLHRGTSWHCPSHVQKLLVTPISLSPISLRVRTSLKYEPRIDPQVLKPSDPHANMLPTIPFDFANFPQSPVYPSSSRTPHGALRDPSISSSDGTQAPDSWRAGLDGLHFDHGGGAAGRV